MGFLTLADFRDELELSLENRTDLTNIRLNPWINFGYRKLTDPGFYPHPELQTSEDITLVQGTNNYALADNNWAIETVQLPGDDNQFTLDAESFRSLNTRRRDGEGRPEPHEPCSLQRCVDVQDPSQMGRLLGYNTH